MVEIIDGIIKGLNGTNVEIRTDDLVGFKDKAKKLKFNDAEKIVSLENEGVI